MNLFKLKFQFNQLKPSSPSPPLVGWLQLLFFAAVSPQFELIQTLLLAYLYGGFTVGLRFIYDLLF